MQVSEEAKRAARDAVRGIGTDFDAASAVPDLAVGNAPLAAPAIDAFHQKWSRSVTAHLEVINATATALAIVAESIIATDNAMADTLTSPGGPR